MDAGQVALEHARVAVPAGVRHVPARGGRLGVVEGVDLVRAVAGRAAGAHQQALLQEQPPVDARLVRLHAVAGRGGVRLGRGLVVAGLAGRRQVARVDARARVAGRQHVVRAVAVLAVRGDVPVAQRAAVQPARAGRPLGRVAGPAVHRLDLVVRQLAGLADAGVAEHAAHPRRAVDRAGDGRRGLHAVRALVLGVAGQADLVRQQRLGRRGVVRVVAGEARAAVERRGVDLAVLRAHHVGVAAGAESVQPAGRERQVGQVVAHDLVLAVAVLAADAAPDVGAVVHVLQDVAVAHGARRGLQRHLVLEVFGVPGIQRRVAVDAGDLRVGSAEVLAGRRAAGRRLHAGVAETALRVLGLGPGEGDQPSVRAAARAAAATRLCGFIAIHTSSWSAAKGDQSVVTSRSASSSSFLASS